MRKQSGATLIVVLLILVSMLLMGFALMRSTDLAALISGNISIKQAATQAGDIGLVAAENALKNTFLSNPDTKVTGYSPTVITGDDGTQILDFPSDLSVLEKISFNTKLDAISWAQAVAIGNGLSYQYYVEKMCSKIGGSDVCATAPSTGVIEGSSLKVNSLLPDSTTTQANIYRITVKISGPRSLETYVQALYSR